MPHRVSLCRDDVSRSALSKLTSLKHLDLSFSSFESRDVLYALAELPKLRHLNLSSTVWALGTRLDHISLLSSLKHLNVADLNGLDVRTSSRTAEPSRKIKHSNLFIVNIVAR